MKSLIYADHTWLVGDDVAAALVDYAVVLARTGSADSVDVNALAPDGDPHLLTLLIGPATMLTAASVHTLRDDPENEDAVAHIRDRIRVIESPPAGLPTEDYVPTDWDELT